LNALRLIISYLTAPFRFLLKGPTYLIAAPRKVWGMRPPARAAAVVAITLVVCTLIVVAVFVLRRDQVHGDFLRHGPGWIAAVVAIILATPTATYYLVRFWLEGDVSRYPDIDRAWEAGIQALTDEGLDVTDLPLYVVFGISSEIESTEFFGASRINTVVSGVPKGKSPLHWYASHDAIYLVCTGLGRLGRLSELAAAGGGQVTGSRRSRGGQSHCRDHGRWRGSWFVFNRRIALADGLGLRSLAGNSRNSYRRRRRRRPNPRRRHYAGPCRFGRTFTQGSGRAIRAIGPSLPPTSPRATAVLCQQRRHDHLQV
jgi:hypothetical protein